MSLAWRRRGEAFVCESWTPDLLADRDERIGWMAERGIPWSIKDGQLSARESKADVLGLIQEAMQLGRTEWKPRMRASRLQASPSRVKAPTARWPPTRCRPRRRA
jgi:hypothetical protein